MNSQKQIEDNSEVLKSRIIKMELVDWQAMQFIQADDFKISEQTDLDKLDKSFDRHGVIDAFMVWQDPETNILWCLDGRRRTIKLEQKTKAGQHVPKMLPALFVDAKSKDDAAELVLLYCSEFGKISQEGLNEHIKTYSLDYEAMKDILALPDFSTKRFEQKFGLTAPEEVLQELQSATVQIIVKPGDVFQLGNHRLICGDSFDTNILETLMQGKKARQVCTDPPYNLPSDFFSGKGKVQHADFAMAAGEMSDNEFVDFMVKVMQTAKNNSLDGAVIYVFMDFRHSWHMGEASKKVFGSPIPKQICVWAKDVAANGSFYRAQHEFCFVYKNGDAEHLSYLKLGERFRSNIWNYAGANSFSCPDRERNGHVFDSGQLTSHPTPKNSLMIADIFKDTTNEGDIVLDIFSGSGTAIIAGEQTDRCVYGVEIEPKYVQSTIVRYYNYCAKNDLACNFVHENGQLTLNDFINNAPQGEQQQD